MEASFLVRGFQSSKRDKAHTSLTQESWEKTSLPSGRPGDPLNKGTGETGAPGKVTPGLKVKDGSKWGESMTLRLLLTDPKDWKGLRGT